MRLSRFYLFHFVNLTSGRTVPMGPTELDMKIDRKHLSRERKSERERQPSSPEEEAGEDGKAHFLWPPRAVCIADR